MEKIINLNDSAKVEKIIPVEQKNDTDKQVKELAKKLEKLEKEVDEKIKIASRISDENTRREVNIIDNALDRLLGAFDLLENRMVLLSIFLVLLVAGFMVYTILH